MKILKKMASAQNPAKFVWEIKKSGNEHEISSSSVEKVECPIVIAYRDNEKHKTRMPALIEKAKEMSDSVRVVIFPQEMAEDEVKAKIAKEDLGNTIYISDTTSETEWKRKEDENIKPINIDYVLPKEIKKLYFEKIKKAGINNLDTRRGEIDTKDNKNLEENISNLLKVMKLLENAQGTPSKIYIKETYLTSHSMRNIFFGEGLEQRLRSSRFIDNENYDKKFSERSKIENMEIIEKDKILRQINGYDWYVEKVWGGDYDAAVKGVHALETKFINSKMRFPMDDKDIMGGLGGKNDIHKAIAKELAEKITEKLKIETEIIPHEDTSIRPEEDSWVIMDSHATLYGRKEPLVIPVEVGYFLEKAFEKNLLPEFSKVSPTELKNVVKNAIEKEILEIAK